MTKKIKLSTFAILVAFIAIIAVSCSERATEPETSLSASATVQPGGDGNTEQPGDTVQPNPSVVYNSLADLYGKTFRTENAVTADGLWYVWIIVEESGSEIQYGIDTINPVHTDKYQPKTTLSENGLFARGNVEVKNGSATITFAEGVVLYSKEIPTMNPYKLVEK